MSLNMIEIRINDQLLEVDLNDLKGNDDTLIGILKQQRPINYELFLKFAIEYYKRQMFVEFEKFLFAGMGMASGSTQERGKFPQYALLLNTLASYYVELARQPPEGKTTKELLIHASKLLAEVEQMNRADKLTFTLKGNIIHLKSTIEDSEKMLNQCLSNYKMAINKDANYVPALIGMANVFYAKNDYKSALLHYQKILTIDPSINPDVRVPIGLCFYQLSMYDEAVAAFQRSLALDPNNTTAVMFLSLTQTHMANSLRPSEQKALIKKAKAAMVAAYTKDNKNALCTLELAERFLEKDHHKAEVMAKTALLHSREPRLRAKATALIGRISHAKKDYSTAKSLFLDAAAVDPDCADIQFSLAQVHIKTGNIETACGCLEKILKDNPEDYDTLKAQAIFLTLKKVLKSSDDDFIQIRDVDLLSDVAKYLEAKDHRKSRRYYEDLLTYLESTGSEIPAELLNNIAVLFHLEAEEIKKYFEPSYRKNHTIRLDDMSEGLYNELLDSAQLNYQKALVTVASENYMQSKEPWFVNALQTTIRYNVARLFETRNEIDKAETYYKEILELHPAFDECILRLGSIELKRGNSASALELYSEALAIDPNNHIAWFMIGHYHILHKNHRAARKSFEKVLEKDKHDVYALTSVGYLCLIFARGDPNSKNRQVHFFRSVEYFCKAIKYEPNNAHATAGIGIALAETLKFAEAVDVFKQIQEIGAGDPVLTLIAGHSLVENGNISIAIPVYESIITKGGFKNDPIVYKSLLRAYYILGKTKRDSDAIKSSLKYAQKLVHLYPSDSSNLYNLALVQQQIAHIMNDQKLENRTVESLRYGLGQLQVAKQIFKFLEEQPDDILNSITKQRIKDRAVFCKSLTKMTEKKIHETEILQRQRSERMQEIKEKLMKEQKESREAEIKRMEEERLREEKLEAERRRLMEEVRLENERSKVEEVSRKERKEKKKENEDDEPKPTKKKRKIEIDDDSD